MVHLEFLQSLRNTGATVPGQTSRPVSPSLPHPPHGSCQVLAVRPALCGLQRHPRIGDARSHPPCCLPPPACTPRRRVLAEAEGRGVPRWSLCSRDRALSGHAAACPPGVSGSRPSRGSWPEAPGHAHSRTSRVHTLPRLLSLCKGPCDNCDD